MSVDMASEALGEVLFTGEEIVAMDAYQLGYEDARQALRIVEQQHEDLAIDSEYEDEYWKGFRDALADAECGLDN